MISRLAKRIVEALCAATAIGKEEKALFQYGFFILLSHFFFFLLTFLLGVLLRVPLESVVFYVVFSLVRTYAGGIHAKTEMVCLILTGIAIVFSVVGILVMKDWLGSVIPMAILIFGIVCVWLISPLDTKEKPLSRREKERTKFILRIFDMGIILFSHISFVCGFYGIFCSLSMAIFLEGCLLILGLFVNDS